MKFLIIFENDNIMTELNDIPWYKLNTSTQKELSYSIENLQNGRFLTMGPFGDVDFQMAADVSNLFQLNIKSNSLISYFQFTKLIYKYIMLLFTLFN